MFPDATARLATALLGSLNSFVFDFVARQKISGIHLPFFTMNQITALPPDAYSDADLAFIVPRVLDSTRGRSFVTSPATAAGTARRSAGTRSAASCCAGELDAALFHRYLPADTNGDWRSARRSDGYPCDETPEQLADLKRHFPTPRDAVAYILDTFPGVRREGPSEARRVLHKKRHP